MILLLLAWLSRNGIKLNRSLSSLNLKWNAIGRDPSGLPELVLQGSAIKQWAVLYNRINRTHSLSMFEIQFVLHVVLICWLRFLPWVRGITCAATCGIRSCLLTGWLLDLRILHIISHLGLPRRVIIQFLKSTANVGAHTGSPGIPPLVPAASQAQDPKVKNRKWKSLSDGSQAQDLKPKFPN